MILAANQPYLFPYAGFFQLLAGADRFVVCDSMQYVRCSWMNRNRLLLQGRPFMITSPVVADRFGLPIRARFYAPGFLEPWRRVVRFEYARAPYVGVVRELLAGFDDSRPRGVAEFNTESIRAVCLLLGINTEFLLLSEIDLPLCTDREQRIISLSTTLGAGIYRNLPGGRALYTRQRFAAAGVELQFLSPYLPPYPQQRTREFFPSLSILDLLMNCPLSRVREMMAGATFTH